MTRITDMAQPVPRPFMVSYQTVNGNACRRFVASGAKEAVLKAIKQIPHGWAFHAKEI
jgi:hypothetical protein